MPSWNEDISVMEKKEDLPKELLDYLDFIEGEVNIPITVISLGPDRKQYVRLK